MRFWLLALLIAAPALATEPTALSDTVKTLASDEFQGRAPGTEGEARTVDYYCRFHPQMTGTLRVKAR